MKLRLDENTSEVAHASSLRPHNDASWKHALYYPQVSIIVFLWLIISCGPVHSAEPVKAVALGISGAKDVAAIPELHVFAAETASVDVAIEAPIGSKLSLSADVIQVTSGIAAKLSEGVILEDADFTAHTRRIMQAKIPLPKVERKIELRVVILVTGQPDSKPAPIGVFRLYVYPSDGVQEFAKMFSVENKPFFTLGVFGAGKQIRAFFTEYKIPFNDLGEETPEEFRSDVLYVGEAKSEKVNDKLRTSPSAHVVFFNTENAPGIYRTVTPGGCVTKITLPILDSLSSNPVSQRNFIEAITQSIQPTL